MNTRLISLMKHQKDTHNAPPSLPEKKRLIALCKTMNPTHLEVSTVIGMPNFHSETMEWMNAIHEAGLLVTSRHAHGNMEGLYDMEKFVGSNRKPTSFWIDEAVNALKELPWKAGDEVAIYPERTEGIFDVNTSFLEHDDLQGNYAKFFFNLHEALDIAINVPFVKFGLSANNASELLSGWMPRAMSETYGVVVVDHYVDGDPVKYEADIRKINQMYGKPVYVQESAPHRFEVPDSAKAMAHYAVNKKLEIEGILHGYGAWGGWSGTPESVISGDALTPAGEALKEWWEGVPDEDDNLPPDEDEPDEDDENITIADVYLEVLKLSEEIDAQERLEMIEDIAWGPGTLSARMKKIKIIAPNI